MSINTVDIPNIDVKVWTRKSEVPQGNLIRSLTKTEITRQRPFGLTYIEYDQIKYEIARMERVEYNYHTPYVLLVVYHIRLAFIIL